MTYQPYTIDGAGRVSRWLITCDHAANTVPEAVNGGDLGLDPADMQRHIAHDIGAKAVSLLLGEMLEAPVICSNFSRLVIDPNRGEDDPTLIMQLYDGTIIPGNRTLDAAERERRLEAYYRPYHKALEDLAARREDTVIVAVHSFAPRLNGRAPRPWEVGILHAPWEERFSRALIERLRAEGDLTVGENEPYPGHLPGDSMDCHALRHGRDNTLIELRQDLIADAAGQRHWAGRLAPILRDVLENM
ncbi:Predicted N-formylglutamate amidohydrolase [Salinihabitans flavidus]|uniref:Predicted N-formylglutamate amidohydrolase n=1 Tax=Salinihabitans flavidus TaxID=569882 RepID=A0A1H8S9Z3_9RHOB|nr:N-formylglutamate amidohydrolase [Salinihabitans flavidus]SEO75377.1 Predicted N-formylglutamate amidohydrolase [Salinihabitans flavidus]